MQAGIDAFKAQNYPSAIEYLQLAKTHCPPEEQQSLDFGSCLNWLGLSDAKCKRYGDAEAAFRQALSIRQLQSGKDNPASLQLLSLLGWLLVNQNRYSDAEAIFRQALSIRQQTPGNNLDTARALDELATVVDHQGGNAEAERLYRQELSIYQGAGDDQRKIVSNMQRIARVISRQKRYSEAESLLRQALAICQQKLGNDPSATAVTLDRLAQVLLDQGKYSEAEPNYRQALSIREKLPDQDDLLKSINLEGLATTIVQQNRYSEAELLLRQSLAIRQQKLGKDKFETVSPLEGLANVIRWQGRYSEAEPLFRQALTIRQQTLGKENVETVPALVGLATMIQFQGGFYEAEALYREALKITEQKFGNEDPATAVILADLADTITFEGRYSEAESLGRKSLAIYQLKEGKDHLDTARALGGLAMILEDRGRHDEATALYRQALAIRQHKLDKNHPDIAFCLDGLASVYKDQKLYGEAERLYRQALSIDQQTLGKTHPWTATELANLATVIQDQERYSEAEQLFKQALAIRGSTRPIDPFKREVRLRRFDVADFPSSSAAQNGAADAFKPQKLNSDDAEMAILRNLRKDQNVDCIGQFQQILTERRKNFGIDDPRTAELLMQMAVTFDTIGGGSRDLSAKAYTAVQKFARSVLNYSDPHFKEESPKGNTNEIHAQIVGLGGRNNALAYSYESMVCIGCLCAANGQRKDAKDAFTLAALCLQTRTDCTDAADVEGLIRLADYYQWLNADKESAELIKLAMARAEKANDIRLKYECVLVQFRLLMDQGEFDEAFKKAKEALELTKGAVPAEPIHLFDCYSALSESAFASGNVADAIRYAQSAATVPANDDERANAMIMLGTAMCASGDQRGIELLQTADALSNSKESNLEQSAFSRAAAALGLEYLKRNNLTEARHDLGWAYGWDKTNPAADGLLASARDLNGLAEVEYNAHDMDLSRRYSLDSSELIDKYIATAFPQLSFNQQCAFLSIAKQQRDSLVNVCQDKNSLAPAYKYMIRWKGLLLESLRQKAALASAIAKQPKLQKFRDDLDYTNGELSSIANGHVIGAHSAEVTTDAKSRYQELAQKRDALEQQLMDASGVSIKDPIANYNANIFRALLKADETFIDIITYKRFKEDSEHYAAIAMKAGNGGEPVFFELGAWSHVHTAVAQWRAAVTEDRNELASIAVPPTIEHSPNLVPDGLNQRGDREVSDDQEDTDNTTAASRQMLSEAVSALLLTNKDLRAYLGPNITKFWICPEGDLAKVPWTALASITCGNTILVCEVDSPREFVVFRTSQKKPPPNENILLAGLSKFKESSLGDLSGALQEVEEIKPIADAYSHHATLLAETAATKEAVRRQLSSAVVAHIATHGFARGSSTGADTTGVTRSANMFVRSGNNIQLVSTTKNPLLDCGLYFAYPKDWHGDPSEMPNVLTAQEIVGLDLGGCDHVTLSACQTGLGRSLNGQGIIGLRSAILGAGAKSILISLWSVPDEATRELMKRFYTYLWNDKLPKVQALARAQSDIRNSKEHPEWNQPKFWAAWVLAGDGF
jgi:CHAT domain-containing protein/Tfp pilus assembly protein PilF